LPEEKIRDIRTATLSSVILGLYLSVPSEEYESLINTIGEMSGTIINTLLLDSKLMRGHYPSVPEALSATLNALRDLVGIRSTRIRFTKGREAEIVIVDCPICEASPILSISPEKPICKILGMLIRKVTLGYLQRLGIETDIDIEETECKAKGAPACLFKLIWKGEQVVHTKYVEWEEQRADEECRARLDSIVIRSSMRTL
jgi:predicted hydrocarbon binding protein